MRIKFSYTFIEWRVVLNIIVSETTYLFMTFFTFRMNIVKIDPFELKITGDLWEVDLRCCVLKAGSLFFVH